MARKVKLGAGYRQRKDGRIEYRWTYEGKRFSVTGHTIEECKKKEDQKRKELARIGYTGNADITLNDYFPEWQHRREGAVKESTLRCERPLFKIISSELGTVKVSKVERRQILHFHEKLKEQYSADYTNAIMKLLKHILKSAGDDGILEHNPCRGIKSVVRTEAPARETIHRALTLEETEAFFKAAAERNSWYYNLYEFLISTGCRIGEAGALMRSDIDYKNNVIHIRRTVTATSYGRIIGNTPKTKTSKRDIPMNAGIREILQKQERRNREKFGENVIGLNDRIFKTIGGCLVTSSGVVQDIRSILKVAGVEHFTPHAFRDTFATRAIEAGMNPQTLKEILGHGSFSMTMDLYAHVMENTKQKEMNLVQIKTGT